jgi:protein-tyrosine-phosphatase
MAEAIYNHLTNSHDAFSVGTYVGAPDEPEGQILSELFRDDPDFFEVMDSHEMDLRNNLTKKLLPEMLDQYNIVVSMAEEPFIPDFLKKNKKVIWWDIKNPNPVPPGFFKSTYDKLNELIKELINKQI